MQGRRGDWRLLRRWAVREHFVPGAYLRMYFPDCLQILHTTPLESLVVPFGVYELWPTFGPVTYLDVLKRISFPEQISKNTWPMVVILHIHDL